MTPAFLRALDFTLSPSIEGGLSDNALDRGGRTNHGITQRTYDAWRTTTGQPRRPVDDITDDEVKAIYFSEYWTPCNCDAIPEPLSLAVFDMAVNSGVYNAKMTLQRAVMVRQDGVIGPKTIAAIKATPNVMLRFLKRRGAFIQEIIIVRADQVAFLEGWINRLLDLSMKAA